MTDRTGKGTLLGMDELTLLPVYRKTTILERSEDGTEWDRTNTCAVGLRIIDGPVTNKRGAEARLVGATVTFGGIKPYVEVRGKPLKKDGTESQRQTTLIWQHDWDRQLIEAAEKVRTVA